MSSTSRCRSLWCRPSPPCCGLGTSFTTSRKSGGKGKKDINLIPDLATRGYQILVTADVNQLYRNDERKLIKKYGFHHVRFQQVGKGVSAMAGAIATIVAGLPAVLPELERADSQRLVLLKAVRSDGKRFTIVDPRVEPPTYWR